MKDRLQIVNGEIYTSTGVVKGGSIVVEDGRIVSISNDNALLYGCEIIDATGMIVGPGGIDMHVHGGGGHDFMESTEEAFRTAIAAHRAHGTTSIFPTIASASNEVMVRAAELCTRLMQEENTPILGLHFEGPYLNPKKTGGQPPEVIRVPEKDEYMSLIEQYPCIRRWDAAPELPGAMEFARECHRHGVVVSLAHTEAEYADVCEGERNGFSLATHFYNAMTGVHNVREFKHIGTIESVYLCQNIDVEVIGDGIHVPPELLHLIYNIKGTDKIALITDAQAAAGTDGTMVFDPRTIIEDGVCKLADRSALAGSIATMDRLVDTVINRCHMSWEDAFRMTATTPARIMGVSNCKGSLAPGMDADIVIYDREAKLQKVI